MPDVEAAARVKIDQQLKDVGWNLTDGISVRLEQTLADGSRADYLLCDRHGRGLAVLEAKKASIVPETAEGQSLNYAKQADVPYIFISNGEEIRFWDWAREAHPRPLKTFYSQADLERRAATLKLKVDPLTIEVDKKVVERPYQLECIDVLCEEVNQGRRKMLVEMATGTGKTRLAAALIDRLFKANAITRVLFLVDRITLATQTDEAFVEHIPDYPCYVAKTGRRFDDAKRITICTLQTMINEYENYSSGYFDLVFTDECHRSIYGKWSGVLKHFDGLQVGLTATPCRLPDDKLADAEDEAFVRDTLRFFELDEPTYRYTLPQAVEDGFLVPYHIYKAKTVKTAAEGGFEVKRSELDWSDMDGETKQAFEDLFAEGDPITVEPSALERKFTIPERNRAMVREFREVMENGYTAKDGVRRKPPLGKTIAFAVTKKHAVTLAQMFDQEFADKKPSPEVRYADFVVSDMGEDDTLDAPKKIKRFKKEAFPKILVSVNMLDTGFDCPEVTNLVFARFTKSAILYQQMRGRGTRKAPHIKKTMFTMFDFVGVTDFHGDDEEEIEGGFVVIPPLGGPKPTPRKLLQLDINDHIDPATRDWLTPDEHGNLVRPPEHELRANDLGIRFEGWLARQNFHSDQMRLVRMIDEKIKANADEIEEWHVAQFTMQPFSAVGGLDRAIQTFGGQEALETMVQSLNEYVFEGGWEDDLQQPAAEPPAS